jgi:serine/threonine-protein kinase
VKHANVVQITDFGRMPDGVPFFVMELLVGYTLGELLEACGPLGPARATRILRKVAGALAAAHAAGVVHRDLKPDNVFLVARPRAASGSVPVETGRATAALEEAADLADVRVVDFGSARIVGTTRLTRSGVVFGTPHYMAPEQASGRETDPRADVYSLGVIMYEIFTGRVPFEADTYMGVLTQHIFVKPVPPTQVLEAARPNAARELGALEPLVLRCLEKKPEDRFASMEELVAALDALAGPQTDDGGTASARASSRAPGMSAWGRPSGAATVGTGLPSLEDVREAMRAAQGQESPRGRRMWVVVGVVGAAMLVLVAAGVHRATSREASPSDLPASANAPASLPDAPTPPSAMPPAVGPQVSPPPASVASTTSAPTVGEPRASDPPVSRKRPAPTAPRPQAPRPDLDDVGDPFATKR